MSAFGGLCCKTIFATKSRNIESRTNADSKNEAACVAQSEFIAYYRVSKGKSGLGLDAQSGVEFVAVDNPHANKLTVHILAAVAQHAREMFFGTDSASPASR